MTVEVIKSEEIRLDLACGQTPKDGYEGVDLYAPNAKHRIDLFRFPWPWATDSVEELFCSHFVEHVPMTYVEPDGSYSQVPKAQTAKDLLFSFMDECWRILKPNAKMTIKCPCARSNRAFQDPTHRRFLVAETFLYFNSPWRKANKLDHYNVSCDFEMQVDPVVPIDLTTLHPEAQMRRFTESWNTVLDWDAKLTAIKPPR